MPKDLYRNDCYEFHDSALTLEFIGFCHSKVQTNEHIHTLITHGMDLISILMPSDNDVNENNVKNFIFQVAYAIEKLGHTSSLLFIKTTCDVLFPNLPLEQNKIKV